MGYTMNGMYYGGNMGGADMAVTAGTPVNWLLIGIIAGSVVLGIVVGIILGKRTMKKRDI